MNIVYGKFVDLKFVPSNQKQWLDLAEKYDKKDVILEIELEKEKRTLKQNDSLHLYYTHLAQELNNAGYTVKKVMEIKKVDIDWNEKLIKELLWRPIQEAITGKKSTTDLNKISEIDIVYDHLNRLTGEIFHIHVPFPKKKEEFNTSGLHKDLEVPIGNPSF